MKRKYDLEERLINFSVDVLRLIAKFPNDIGARNLANQLSRSSTSPALNYGEAQGAESDKDFLHKLKICIKELRETQINLKIVKRVPYHEGEELDVVILEVSQLVAIFQKSIQTKVANMKSRGEKRKY